MSDVYDFLLKVKNGYDPGWGEIRRIDDLIGDLDFNEKNPGLSVVTIEFNDYDKYLDLFEDSLDAGDKSTIIEFLQKDYYSGDDDEFYYDGWINGFFYNELNDENKEKIEKIFLFISNKSDLSLYDKLKLFYDEFGSESYDIAHEYGMLRNSCINDVLYDKMIEEFGNKFQSVGIREQYPLYKYKVSVNILLKLFVLFDVKDGDVSDLLKKIIARFDKDNHGGYYDEMYYNVDCPELNNDKFNREAEWYIDRILDNLMDDEKFSNIEQYFEIKSIINNEYGLDKWIPLKRSKNSFFKVNDISPETNKIIVTIKNNEGREEKRSLTYDELKQLESQYELFNEIKKIKKFFVI